jgi:hypothetical protein
MKTILKNYVLRSLCIPVIIIILYAAGCAGMSEFIKGDDDTMNGGFEVVKNGLPVNWYYYSPGTVSEGEFGITSDSLVFKEGRRSLKFSVRQCSSIGGRFSPGFFEDFSATAGETYKVSFWVKNEGCRFRVYLQSSEYGKGSNQDTIVATSENFEDWKYFETDFKVHYGRIRFEANILGPGTIWFDDVRIEGLTDHADRKVL